MATSGVRISELNRYDVGKLNEVDSLLVPISYNGATKVISIGDIMSLFSNNEQDVTQNENISANADAISYLATRLQEMAAASNLTIQNFIDSQHAADAVQDSNIANNVANISKQTNINATQQIQIDDMQSYISSINTKLIQSIQERTETDNAHDETISYNTQKIDEQTTINLQQEQDIAYIKNNISTLENINVWGVYNE